MTGRWFFHKTRLEKATKFGIVGARATQSIYVAPRPMRHLPTECRLGWLCGERGAKRIRLGRKHLLARPQKGSRQSPQSVVAQLLPSVFMGVNDNPVAAFKNATEKIGIGANEVVVGISDVRRVRIEGTGVVALEQTRCTQTIGGARVVTLFWAIYIASKKTLCMARICAEGEAELRTYRTQVADFLRRWTASASVATEKKNILVR